ncbi:exodeoxyribonuclease V, alpha subunit domain protein [Mycobacterium xenopi 4042]|uniref:Exodeoxyribonuclease V, alpha subunit domain protein n=1 Tax=Mycobacterium xenopi 4042 TaxID=1299334 RepID=X8C9S8_MYCXE|nr:exodeoxyribonuclease V, alpha subunit domain protein [Mycobacterium xenopi 4042]
MRTHRLQQPRHQGQRHHGRFVDHNHVVRQPVPAIVFEP